MGNRKILFRIPLTIYFLVWDSDLRKLLLAVKKFDGTYGAYEETNGYYFKYLA